MEDRVRFALEKLLDVAHGDTGQSRRVANFILAWWNADVHGGFNLTDLADVDRDVCEDMVTVFTFLAREEDLVYPEAYKPEIIQIIRRWRPDVEID
ncbi:DUF7673 family protein [Agrobacterium pusense]|jgi:hypothetical protein|uniref:DUF7673 family protein n=1 Tax=Agrobacterium pusense TaxID=648995 RepID=UPI0007D7619F|nr:hypothetical protein [Agrobacterium pusense]MBM7325358.1 hypothetical protein [Agrobacterium sp. S2]OAI83038.1 hypothetical protein AYO27_18035 [Rhizobium sp. GHKF11]PTV71622.1 hypothetical protein DBL06_23320 [Agrobacterium pusense]